MFDLGWSEMMIVGVLALIIVGPKDLPRVFKQVSYWIKQLRVMASEFQSGIDEMVKEADLEDAKKVFDKAQDFNPKNQFKKIIDPDNELDKDLDIEAEFKDFSIDESLLFKGNDPDKLVPNAAAKTKKAPAKKSTVKKTATKKASPTKTGAKTAVKTSAVKKPAAKKAVVKKATSPSAKGTTAAKSATTKPAAKKKTTAKSTKSAKS